MKAAISRLAREPLFQFLFVAVLLFGGERLINADDYANAQFQISIDDGTLVQFMQLRAKTFKPADAMGGAESAQCVRATTVNRRITLELRCIFVRRWHSI